MVKTEYYTTREDGVALNRSYSDRGLMIERNGVQYSEAIDPADLGRTYTETDVPVEQAPDSETAEALRILMGGEQP